MAPITVKFELSRLVASGVEVRSRKRVNIIRCAPSGERNGGEYRYADIYYFLYPPFYVSS